MNPPNQIFHLSPKSSSQKYVAGPKLKSVFRPWKILRERFRYRLQPKNYGEKRIGITADTLYIYPGLEMEHFTKPPEPSTIKRLCKKERMISAQTLRAAGAFTYSAATQPAALHTPAAPRFSALHRFHYPLLKDRSTPVVPYCILFKE
jgi:hypothetical protein